MAFKFLWQKALAAIKSQLKSNKSSVRIIHVGELAWEWDDGVDVDWMNGLAVSGDYGQLVTFNCDLCWAHRWESVDHAESVASAGCHREDLQRCVCHETGVWIAELTFTVNQHRLGILTCVHCQTSRVSLSGIFVQPIRQQHDVGRQIEVIQMRIWVAWRWLTNHNWAVQTVELLQTCMRMPEVSSCVTGPLISAGRKRGWKLSI